MSSRRITAALLIAGAVLANAAFLGLGAVFGYPDVLAKPPGIVLAEFRLYEGAVVGWFLLLALGAALLAPAAVMLGRLSSARAMRVAVPVGIAAAAVQVIGLSRWPLLVVALAEQAANPTTAADAEQRFALLSTILGTALGETAGYVLTALWTLLVVLAFAGGPRWFAALGLGSALLIASGVFVPLGLPAADLTNFLGYVLWSLWLIALAVGLIRGGRPAHPGTAGGASGAGRLPQRATP